MANVSNTFSMTSTSGFTLDEVENFAKMLRSAGAAGNTRISTKETHGDRPGELSSYSMSASVTLPEKKYGHQPGYRGTSSGTIDEGFGPRETIR